MRNTALILLVFFFCLPMAQAGKLIAVKQNKVLVQLDSGEQLQVGDKLLIENPDNHQKKALVQITQVKGTRAIGNIVKGSAQINDLAKKARSKNDSGGTSTARSSFSTSPQSWGVDAGYSMNSMTVNFQSPYSGSAAMSGSSYSLRGFYTQDLDHDISVKAGAGLETMNTSGSVSGSAPCTNCNANISYLGLDGLVRYHFYNKSVRVWGGAGLGFLFAMSKSSNALDTSKISTNETVIGALGVDYPLSSKSYIPLELDYIYWPSNATTSAHQIILRVGYGMNF